MSTLSLDLRGVDATRILAEPATARGAGLSLLLHCAGVSTLVVSPLLQSTNPPELADARAAPLARPLAVTLPPAPPPVVPAGRPAQRASVAQAISPISMPRDVPGSFSLSRDLGFEPGPASAAAGADDSGAPGGACPLGSLCGAAAGPVERTPSLVRVGGVIREPRLLFGRAPIYPPIAQAAGASGRVILDAHVGVDGRVREVRITESHTLFDEAALASVRSRRYEPLLLNGVPTEFLVTVTVAFTVRR